MRFILLLLACLTLPLLHFGQRHIEYRATLSGQAATEREMPMWATANRFGITPDSRGGLLQVGFFSDFNNQKKVQLAYGISGAGFLTQNQNKILIDEFYLKLRWQKLQLDLGMVHPKEEFNGISAQNGSFVVSSNSRTMPGYNLHSEYINVPLTKGFLAFKFNLSDYLMMDKRFVDDTRLHNKSLYLRITPHERWEIIAGLGHWVQWAGTSPVYGKQPDSFRDYIKIFTARSGGSGATVSDSINALGNHLGSRYFRINYTAPEYTISFYFDNFFEDGRIHSMQSFPDGAYGIYYGAKEKRQWISDIMYELVYSKYQSGRYHDRPATPEEMAKQDPSAYYYGRIILGGNDNDFNNGEYRSGWTYYGRTIGTPFITPNAPNADGITLGVYNNRVIAHYIGLRGYVAKKLPYKLRLSYSLNYGTYSTPLINTPQQFSFGLETGILNKTKAPFHINIGIFGDFGELLGNNLGMTLQITRNGIIK